METGTEQRPEPGGLPWARLAIVGLAGGFLLLLAVATFRTSTDSPDNALVGRAAPAFELPVLGSGGGARMSLAELTADGQPIVINMWASWCVACADEAKDLQRFYEQYRSEVKLVGIAVQDKPEDAMQFAEYYGMNYPLALDEKGRIGIDYGILGLPETFLLDRRGVVRKRITGAVTAEQLVAEIRALEGQS